MCSFASALQKQIRNCCIHVHVVDCCLECVITYIDIQIGVFDVDTRNHTMIIIHMYCFNISTTLIHCCNRNVVVSRWKCKVSCNKSSWCVVANSRDCISIQLETWVLYSWYILDLGRDINTGVLNSCSIYWSIKNPKRIIYGY